MASKEIGFKAKKEIPAAEVDVTNSRVVITPPTKDENGKEILGTVNYNIGGVKPIEIPPDEMDGFWKQYGIPWARRAPNLKDVTPETATAVAIP